MRQNLTNVKETQLDKVDSFYIVGSTTKEGLIEGRSNVKIDLKKAVAEGGGGSEDAQKLFEMFFGQMPYVFNANEIKPITEYSTEELQNLCNTSGTIRLIYKEQEPAAMVDTITANGTISINVRAFSNTTMVIIPKGIPNAPWYYPILKEDIDLSNFTTPTDATPIIELTGVEIPQKERITVKQMKGLNPTIVTYDWNSEANQYEAPKDGYIIRHTAIPDAWVWSLMEGV